MGRGDRITADLTPPTFFYAVSQGALGIEIREDDTEALELCHRIAHRETSWKCAAERACLKVLEGGCSVPVGVATELKGDTLIITGCVTSVDGKEYVEHTLEEAVVSQAEAIAVGEQLAEMLLESGARKILEDIHEERDKIAKEVKPIQG